jgi:hypothetical protein
MLTPFGRGYSLQIGRIHRYHAVGGKQHHHGGDVCGIVVLVGDGTFCTIPIVNCRNPTGKEFFVPAGTL